MPINKRNSSIEGLVIISRDISERKQEEKLLIKSEKLSIVGELASGVAHELWNPLTKIVKEHRGEMEFHSELGKGTSVHIIFPLTTAE